MFTHRIVTLSTSAKEASLYSDHQLMKELKLIKVLSVRVRVCVCVTHHHHHTTTPRLKEHHRKGWKNVKAENG